MTADGRLTGRVKVDVGPYATLKTQFQLAQEQGITAETFAQTCQKVDFAGHLAQSQGWLRRLGGQGFPTLGLMRGGSLIPLPVSSFLGEPQAFASHLAALMAA